MNGQRRVTAVSGKRRLFCESLLAAFALGLLLDFSHASEPALPEPATRAAGLPQVAEVESQALLAQVDRLTEALNYMGRPLAEADRAAIAALRQSSDQAEVARRVQEILDPYAIAAVEIKPGQLEVTPRAESHELVEQGWRSFLVKVCNAAESTSRLQVESLNALPAPAFAPEGCRLALDGAEHVR